MSAQDRSLRLVRTSLLLALAGTVIAGEPDEELRDLKALVEAGRYDEAERGARALLAEVKAARGAGSLAAASVLDVLVESLWRSGAVGDSEAQDLALRAVAIKERELGTHHLETVRSLQRLALVLRDMGDYTAARPLLERVLRIREKTLGPGDPGVAATLNNLGVLFVYTGDYAAARPLFERALSIQQKTLGPDHVDVVGSLNNLANLVSDMGDFAAAQPLYERALRIVEKTRGPDDPVLAQTLNNLGTYFFYTGAYAEARPVYERALGITEKAFGPDHPDVAMCLNNLAVLLQASGDYARALPLHERALTIREKALDSDHPDVGESLENIAILFYETGDPGASRPLAERALTIKEKALGPDHPTVAGSLNTLANVLVDAGDYAAAQPLYERALGIAEKTFGPDHPDVATKLDSLAVLHWNTGRYQVASLDCERALAIRKKAFGSDNPGVARSLNNLSYVRAIQGDNRGALGAALAAEDIGRDHLRLTGRILSETEALRFASVRTSGLDLALTLASQGLDGPSRRSIFDAVARTRAVVLDEIASRRRAVRGTPKPEVAEAARIYSVATSRLAHLVVRGLGDQTPEVYRTLLDGAKDEHEKAERALARASADFAKGFSRARLGVDEIAANLPPGSALIAFVQYRNSRLGLKDGTPLGLAGQRTRLTSDRTTAESPGEIAGRIDGVPWYLAFVLRRGARDPRVVDLGPAEEIDTLVMRWRQAVSAGALSPGEGMEEVASDCHKAGTALRTRVWDPVVAAINGAMRLFVVPDGSLNLVNLVALPSEDGGYLLERGPLVHYLSAERDLVPLTDARRGEGLLALGGPAYDAKPVSAVHAAGQSVPGAPSHGDETATTSTLTALRPFRGAPSGCRDFSSTRFVPLAGTEREVDELVTVWRRSRAQSVERLTGDAASEAAFKEKSVGHRVLHLATHAFFLGGRCVSALDSSRGVAGLTSASAQPPPVAGENPLVLAGLALAGANRRADAGPEEEDGILTAEEVAALDLSDVEWAVLSACDTGVGEVKVGEGVFGLRRAFQLAGTGTVIMSLWPVDDEATRQWMHALYEGRLVNRLTTAEAVREASLKVLRDRRTKHLATSPSYWGAYVAAGDWR
jgi:CHAT domain-containing protein/tetratricopeptide (TPR) repeat protein